jgi:diketogulonate reductase-like aldo/keto reductase
MATTFKPTDSRTRALADGNQIPLLGLGVWQVPDRPLTVNAVRWARELGNARPIGVSNFGVRELDQVLAAATIPLVVDQMQFSPFEYRRALLEGALQRRVAVEAYSPLGTGRHLYNQTVQRIEETPRFSTSPSRIRTRPRSTRSTGPMAPTEPPNAHAGEAGTNHGGPAETGGGATASTRLTGRPGNANARYLSQAD